MASESQHQETLKHEGYARVYVWQDGPNAFYPDHTHHGKSAHIILDGEMTLTMQGNSQTYRAGERVDVPGGVAHSAKMGPQGCRYLIGE